MKLSTFSQMIQEYELRPIDSEDIEERGRLLISHKYSVIFEGDFLEFDSLQLWIKENINSNPIVYLFYGKLDYDYGYFELFFNEQSHFEKIMTIIPTLFTTYPNGKVSKTNGYNQEIYP
jgi:hypothetical protein